MELLNCMSKGKEEQPVVVTIEVPDVLTSFLITVDS